MEVTQWGPFTHVLSGCRVKNRLEVTNLKEVRPYLKQQMEKWLAQVKNAFSLGHHRERQNFSIT